MIGIPFVDFGRDPEKGLDCFGFAIDFVLRGYGVTIPDPLESFQRDVIEAGGETLIEPYKASWRPVSPRHLAPGDLLLFAFPGPAIDHIGVFLDDGWMVHCLKPLGVVRGRVSDYRSRLRRVLRHDSFLD